MYTKAIRKFLIDDYACAKSFLASTFPSLYLPIDFLRFQYPHDYSKSKIKTRFPGPNHLHTIQNIQTYDIDQLYQVFPLANPLLVTTFCEPKEVQRKLFPRH